MECPCRWCEDRKVGCHAKCKPYLDYAKVLEETRKKVAEKLRNDYNARPAYPKRRRK